MMVVRLFTVLSDLGLGLALVRRKDDLLPEEFDTVFTFQFVLTTSLCLCALAAAPAVLRFFPTIDRSGLWLIRVLVLDAWIGTFRLIPSVKLQRKLAFSRIALVEVIENAAFHLVAVACALGGLGVWSLVAASVGRSIVGLGMLACFSPFRVRFRGYSPRLKETILVGTPLPELWARVAGEEPDGPRIHGEHRGRNTIRLLRLGTRPGLQAPDIQRTLRANCRSHGRTTLRKHGLHPHCGDQATCWAFSTGP